MKQLVQNLKSGEMKIWDVPAPVCGPHEILVQASHSVISAGTEGSKVTAARKGYVGKAMERPDQVREVLASVRQEGLATTYMKVMNKLETPAPLGYSLAGYVLEAGNDVTDFAKGDLVACGGAEAGHAEIVSVPVNLVVKVPLGVQPAVACLTTIAAIALQGIRRSGLDLGASCAIIGMGLIGQLTALMLHASGVRVSGIDVEERKIAMAKKNIPGLYLARAVKNLENQIIEFSKGQGVDSVIITAGCKSLDPVELAGRLCRKKGKVVIVGAVPTGFSREVYYKKELDLLMSTSYGPGRYDDNYEQKGIDYPYGYVRWTENRNMQAFINLCAEKRIDPGYLITHEFDFNHALQAYNLILKNSEFYLGVVLKYSSHTEKSRVWKGKSAVGATKKDLCLGFLGAGTFAQKYLLPVVAGEKGIARKGVVTRDAISCRHIAEKFDFGYGATDSAQVLADPDIGTVFIATRHDSHANLVIKALAAGKNVFVEKPLVRTRTELVQVASAIRKYERQHKSSPLLLVGYNRRFAPHVQTLYSMLSREQPSSMMYRINAGAIPADHWIQDREVGGGRIVGEVCHFIDLLSFLAQSPPVRVSAHALPDPLGLQDSLEILLSFANGSCGTILYHANGNASLPKEYLEVHQGGNSFVIDDFKLLSIHQGKKVKTVKLGSWDKGHRNQVRAFLNTLRGAKTNLIPIDSLLTTSLTTFLIEESIKSDSTIVVDQLVLQHTAATTLRR